MIVRSVDVNDLEKFDFFNDAKDTIAWLERTGRFVEAAYLEMVWNSKQFELMRTKGRMEYGKL